MIVGIVLSAIALIVNSFGTTHTIRVPSLSSDGVAIQATPVPTPTSEPTQTPSEPTPVPVPVRQVIAGKATHYGESFNGRTMGCGGTYFSWDISIAAVPYPSRNSEWPCGTRFTVSGPAGSIDVMRTDSCPGCSFNHLDLSEAGILAVCGFYGTCNVEIWVWQ